MPARPNSQDNVHSYFPVARCIFRAFTGRWAKRLYLTVLLLLLTLTSIARLRSYFMARNIQAVLRALAAVRIDQTSEEQLVKMVPYLGKSERNKEGNSRRVYLARISNES